MYAIYSCAWMCSAIAIFCAGFGSCLYARAPGGSSANETSCAISARVRMLKVPVLLMTIGMKEKARSWDQVLGVKRAAARYGWRVGGIVIGFMLVYVFLSMASMVPTEARFVFLS